MNETGVKRVQQLFLAVMQIPEKERREWLIDKCAGDRALYDEVLSLLPHDPPVHDSPKERLGTDWAFPRRVC